MGKQNNREDMSRRLTPEERALRVKKLKRKRRFRLAIVIAAFALILLAVAAAIISLTAFRVKKYDIEGISRYSREEIIESCGIEEGVNLLFLDVEAAAEGIEKNLPYTDDVTVTKKLPNTVVIRYGETTEAFALRISDGTYALTNGDLKVLDIVSGVPEGMSIVQGATPATSEVGETLSFKSEKDEKADRTFELIQEITSCVAENEMEDINLIDVSSANNIYMIYQERMVLRIGEPSDIPSKLSLGKRVIVDEDKIDPTQSATINLTIAKKAYVNPSDPEEIKELVIYNGGEWVEEEEEIPPEEATDGAEYTQESEE